MIGQLYELGGEIMKWLLGQSIVTPATEELATLASPQTVVKLNLVGW